MKQASLVTTPKSPATSIQPPLHCTLWIDDIEHTNSVILLILCSSLSLAFVQSGAVLAHFTTCLFSVPHIYYGSILLMLRPYLLCVSGYWFRHCCAGSYDSLVLMKLRSLEIVMIALHWLQISVLMHLLFADATYIPVGMVSTDSDHLPSRSNLGRTSTTRFSGFFLRLRLHPHGLGWLRKLAYAHFVHSSEVALFLSPVHLFVCAFMHVCGMMASLFSSVYLAECRCVAFSWHMGGMTRICSVVKSLYGLIIISFVEPTCCY